MSDSRVRTLPSPPESRPSQPPPQHTPAVDICGDVWLGKAIATPEAPMYVDAQPTLNAPHVASPDANDEVPPDVSSTGHLAPPLDAVSFDFAFDEIVPRPGVRCLECGGVPQYPNDGTQLWDDALSEAELWLICGVYCDTLGSETGSRLPDLSWWSKPAQWQGCGLDLKYWTPDCERWYQTRRSARMSVVLPPVNLPEGVESKHLPVKDLNVHYLSAGDPKAPLLVLLHGFPELCYSWRKVLVPLAKLGYHVVAPDSRGYGRTTSLNEPNKVVSYDDDISPYSMFSLAYDIVALVFALGHKTCAAVVGHDFGSPVAGHAALIRPDIFQSVILMSAPFTGPPSLPFDVAANPPPPGSQVPFWVKVDQFLANLDPPRKHYTAYYTTRDANGDMLNAPQGLHAFLRAYFHQKSADWTANDPRPITIPEAGQMPHYYIMPVAATMADVAAEEVPSAESVAQNTWLPESELQVITAEYGRTGFQGGLNRYRCARTTRWADESGLFAGRKIEVPAMYLSGRGDWGVYQYPGAATKMKNEVCSSMADEDFVLVEGAGHWVQQEKPEDLVEHFARFLRKFGLSP
ncbi:hypothetical protein EUX98_g1566 [Antrodiella citrinella]|uniref:AB hydrolase-1 domain-containing protein n=1 Tax=Antrodiella citrinella TaxID=2447956 RepID=A0A4V3XJE7_9APHY|nr:hypothetical protein EUX98_g1566 [Antrodiella citrinella]